MERKIGEIFEYNGEWYQCVECNNGECRGCPFNGNCSIDVIGYCGSSYRSDGKTVIFKKLEKVGEPYEYFVHGNGIIMVQEYILYNLKYARDAIHNLYIFDCQNGRIAIEIKQKQEDMEEKKIRLRQEEIDSLRRKFKEITQDYVIQGCDREKIQYEFGMLFESTQGPYNEGEKLNLKPFDLEAARSGKPVCTRDGRKARIICFDAKRKDEKNIIALVPSKDYPGFEDLIPYPNSGNYYGGHENDGDLMMLPEKHEGWVNVYRDFNVVHAKNVFDTRKEALKNISGGDNYIVTAKIEWYE